MNAKKKTQQKKQIDELENLGLDADHSSDNFSVNGQYNGDNERIASNPDGEQDQDTEVDQAENSPLNEK